MKRVLIALAALGVSGCVSPSEGNVFAVKCYSGEALVWQSDKVVKFTPRSDRYSVFHFADKDDAVWVGGAVCVVLEVFE